MSMNEKCTIGLSSKAYNTLLAQCIKLWHCPSYTLPFIYVFALRYDCIVNTFIIMSCCILQYCKTEAFICETSEHDFVQKKDVSKSYGKHIRKIFEFRNLVA